MKVVAVDVCFTLINNNTTIDFIDFLLQKNIKYKLIKFFGKFYQFIDPDFIRKLYIKQLGGFTREELNKGIKLFFEVKSQNFNKKVLDELKKFQRNEYVFILLSASLDIVVEYLSNKFGFDSYGASVLEFQNNICTGRLSFDCAKDGKFEYFQKMMGDNFKNINLEESYFFSDSFDDKKVFEVFGNSYVIINNNKYDSRFDTLKCNFIKMYV